MSIVIGLFILCATFIVASAFTGTRMMSLNARKYAKISSSTTTMFYNSAVHSEMSTFLSKNIDNNSKYVQFRHAFSSLSAKDSRRVNKITRESEDEFFESNVSTK